MSWGFGMEELYFNHFNHELQVFHVFLCKRVPQLAAATQALGADGQRAQISIPSSASSWGPGSFCLAPSLSLSDSPSPSLFWRFSVLLSARGRQFQALLLGFSASAFLAGGYVVALLPKAVCRSDLAFNLESVCDQ